MLGLQLTLLGTGKQIGRRRLLVVQFRQLQIELGDLERNIMLIHQLHRLGKGEHRRSLSQGLHRAESTQQQAEDHTPSSLLHKMHPSSSLRLSFFCSSYIISSQNPLYWWGQNSQRCKRTTVPKSMETGD